MTMLALGLSVAMVASTAPAIAAAERGLWVAYDVSVESGTSTPESDGNFLISQGGGSLETFVMRVRSASDGTVMADLAGWAGFDNYNLEASDIFPESRTNDPYSLAGRHWAELETALRHHRPVVRFRVDSQGRAEAEMSVALRGHRECARRLLTEAQIRLIENAENEAQRELQRERLNNGHISRRLELPLRSPALLIQLLRLDLPSTANGTWSKFEHLRTLSLNPDRRSDQYGWRSEQIRLHGSEVGLNIDLLADGRSPAAHVCQSIKLEGVGTPVSEGCNIDAFVDRRDGWPIVISISRNLETATGATAGRGVTFYRLTPLEGFVPPPDPCAAAER
jgi:hypothetical protein